MSVASLLPPVQEAPPPRKRFTRAEVQQMEDSGLLAGQRFELIEGDLIDKMAQKPPHAAGVAWIHEFLVESFGVRRVRVQMPVEVAIRDQAISLPEPDCAVLAERKLEYDRGRHPRGDELLLIVEVSDSSLQQDLVVKSALYARAGVPEYWILDVTRRELHILRDPRNGEYTAISRHAEADTIAPSATPEARTLVSALLPR